MRERQVKQGSGGKYFLLLMMLIMGVGAWLFLGNGKESEAQETVPVQEAAVVPAAEAAVDGVKVLVLNYHKIDNKHHSLAVKPEDFESQLKYLSDHGYHSISPDELYEGLAGTKPLPENPVLITFDDGYKDNYTTAFPLLKKYGFKATIFAVTSFLGKQPQYFTWEQAREMEQHGISIQSHTATHRSMTDLSDEELRSELADSKRKAEEELGHPVEYMAYPTGTYNLHIAEMVKEAGYKAAFTIKYGNVDEASNIYALERVPVFHTAHTNRDFLERIRYTPIFEKFGWTKS
ncbi:polysaccharide deacetylase family protein [Selenomonas sp. KH1T6]|uniref:polysaccharide deacetylase family protein n=1 Tax=Selenomonas sp. KH1T6 TaxID=3158784 RepID=UPI0008A737B0|nr:Polysaccharide deacetylase [Selenomonas ruminantium]